MKVTLLNHTPNPEDAIISAAAICYKSLPRKAIIKHCIKSGHHSVLEFADFDFLVEDVSRVTTHQIVRKRVGTSFAQESQRYVCYDGGFEYIIPDSIENSEVNLEAFKHQVNQVSVVYDFLVKNGVKAEDARFILPNATCANMRIKVNARTLIDLGKERLCTTSQWEIRELITLMKEAIKDVAPLISEYMQPKCFWLKRCPEDEKRKEHEGINCNLWLKNLQPEDLKWIKTAYEYLKD